MKRSVLIALVAIVTTMTFTQCLFADAVDIPVVMNIAPIASIVLNGAQIELLPVLGSMNYEGATLPPNQPIITCNVQVTVTANTVGISPFITTDWQTALQGTAYNGTSTSDPILVDPLATPFNLGVSVLAGNVDMTVRPDGLANVATTTVTVTP
ncbi:MAG: hypothetical protein JW912_06310 [Sedimentisphaerales bacterium]|nr:hypothetical protein [Sedimentisphaerales bacterium]